jgi:hypothetical protein
MCNPSGNVQAADDARVFHSAKVCGPDRDVGREQDDRGKLAKTFPELIQQPLNLGHVDNLLVVKGMRAPRSARRF